MDHDTQPDDTQPDDTNDFLARDLERAGDEIAVGDRQEMLVAVRARAAHRRRRRNSIVGLAAAATLIVSGVVVAQFVGGDSDDERIVSAPATEPSDTEPVDSAPTDPGPSVTSATSTDAVVVPVPDASATEPESSDNATPATESVAVAVAPSVVSEAPGPGGTEPGAVPQHQLYPWRGGVLAISTSYAPQPLPAELSPEINEAFPPEVTELFPDGLPPTIEEAVAILQEAGLLDEVTQILADNPEVSDAIYSQPPAEPTSSVRFSSDGVEWTDIEAALPEGTDLWNMTSTGERLVVARPVSEGQPLNGPVGPGFSPPMPDAIEVYSSTDLVEWSIQTLPLPELATGVDPAFAQQVYVHRAAATESGFVVSFEASTDFGFDVIELLEPELRDRINSSAGGYSLSQGDEGVTIGLSDSDDPNETTESFSFTWAELGIDAPPPTGPSGTIYRYAGTWDGAPPTLVEASGGWSDISAVNGVFVATGPPSAQWSADGVDWIPLEVPAGETVVAVVEADEGATVVTYGGNGEATIYVGDLTTGDLRSVSIPELPEQVQPEQFGAGALLLADYGNDTFSDPFADAVGSRESAEADGYLYEMESSWGPDGRVEDDHAVTYRLIDLGTGDVVVTETASGADLSEQAFEYLDHQSGFGDGFRILDPATGEPLVTIRYDAVVREMINPDGSVTDLSSIDFPEPPMGPMDVEHWVVAFVSDGVIVQPIETGEGPDVGFPVSVVRIGDVVLVARSNGMITRVSAA